jgi:hypothetical protein
MEVDRVMIVPETERNNVRLPIVREANPAHQGFVEDSIDLSPVRDLAVFASHGNLPAGAQISL